MNGVYLTAGVAAIFLVLAHLRNVANGAGSPGPVAPTYAQPLPDFNSSGGDAFTASPFDALSELDALTGHYANIVPDLNVVDLPPTGATTPGGAPVDSAAGERQSLIGSESGSFFRAAKVARPISTTRTVGSSQGGVFSFAPARPVSTGGNFGTLPAAPTSSNTGGIAPHNPGVLTPPSAPTITPGNRTFKPTTGLSRP